MNNIIPGFADGRWFGDWQRHTDCKLSKALLWDVGELNEFDFEKGKNQVLQRVLERGTTEDFYAAINLYGGLDNFKESLKEVYYLSSQSINFIEQFFNIPKTELRCYIHAQSRAELLSSWSGLPPSPSCPDSTLPGEQP